VYVRGESWTARAEEPIPVGTPVVVVDREELTLYVAVLKEKHREAESVEEA
ncbi:MAG: NfeD family protein, partial [Anaerolineae bacterium]|nr:NfeD family protein [Anaerolineae bacterium]